MGVNTRVFVVAMGGFLIQPTTMLCADNPYQAIVARNVFGLKDPPPPASTTTETPPPPKIQLQGITIIAGRPRVHFKVATPAKPPQPASETSMMLAVGEAENEIEVLEIDEAAGSVKFNNHGTVETKTMADDAAKPSAVAVAAPVPGAAPQSPIAIPRPALPTPAPGLQSIPTRRPPAAGDSPIPSPVPGAP